MKTTLVAAGVALLLGAAVADAALVCARRNGRLVRRSACRAAERPFDPSRLGIIGPIGPTGAPGAAGVQARFPVRIVDADGQEVGEIEYVHPRTALVQVRRAPLDQPVLFFVGQAGFVPNVGAAYYTSADCVGTPHVREQPSPLPNAQVYGAFAYVPGASDAQSLQAQSSEFDTLGEACPDGSSPTTRGTCCSNYAQDLPLQPAARVPLAALGFTPPFRAVRPWEKR